MQKPYIMISKARIAQQLPEIRTWYEHLHAHPERSFEEQETAAYIAERLKNMGLEVHRLPQNAVIGYLAGANTKSTIGLRAELDALPLHEQTGVKYASRNAGVMHACGHDLHMACALGAAKLLSENISELKHNILFVFQHAEEKIPGGAKDVIENDFFRQHKPDVMMALHAFPELKAGKVGFRSGPYMASGDEIDVHIKGPGGHAAMPHKTVDTVLTAGQVLVALQQIQARFIPTEIPSVLTFGNICTESVMNIIPREVLLEGTFRTMSEEWRKKALKKIIQIVDNTSKAAGATSETIVRPGYPAIKNDEAVTRKIQDIATNLLGARNITQLPLRMTTDDFGYYAQQIPSAYFRLGVADSNGRSAGLHTPEFLPDDRALETGVMLLAQIMQDF